MNRETKTNISKLFLEEKQKLEEEKNKKKEEKNQQDVMREIELKTEKKVMLILEKGNADDTNVLHSIMSDGAKEFKEKTGRQMTYSEMREMFG